MFQVIPDTPDAKDVFSLKLGEKGEENYERRQALIFKRPTACIFIMRINKNLEQCSHDDATRIPIHCICLYPLLLLTTHLFGYGKTDVKNEFWMILPISKSLSHEYQVFYPHSYSSPPNIT